MRLEAIISRFTKQKAAKGFPRSLVLVLLGAMMSLGQAPLGFWPLSFVGLFIWARLFALGHGPKQVAKDSWLIGFGYFFVLLHWIVWPFLVEPERDGWMAPFALVLLPSGLALFWAITHGVARRLAGHAPYLAWAIGLSLAELGRGHLFTGFPWGGFSHVLLETPASGLYAVFGAEGLSILMLLAIGLMASVTQEKPMRLLVLAVPFVFLALPYRPDEAVIPADAPTVRLVQPNAPQDEKWDPLLAEVFYQRLLTYSAAPGTPDLILWPETAISYVLEFSEHILAEIAEKAVAPVGLGINRIEGERFYNAFAFIDTEGQVQHIYDKQHLVPFGEYVPFGEVFAQLGIYGLAASQGGGYSAGRKAEPFDLGAIGRVKVLICYEGIFPWEVINGERPDVLILATNDAWFGTWAGPAQHMAQARIRAIETGLPMLRVANTGITALIGTNGEILADLPFGQQGMLDVKLPAPEPLTVFVKFKGWPAILLLAIVTFWIISPFGRIPIDRKPRRA